MKKFIIIILLSLLSVAKLNALDIEKVEMLKLEKNIEFEESKANHIIFRKKVSQGQHAYKMGVIDLEGNEIIEAKYKYLFFASDDKLVFENYKDESNKIGLIDIKGNILLKNEYEEMRTFSDNVLIAYKDEKYVYFDNNLKEIFSLKAKYASNFNDSRAFIITEENGKDIYTIIDKKGQKISSEKFTNIEDFYMLKSIASIDEKIYVIDHKGKKLEEIKDKKNIRKISENLFVFQDKKETANKFGLMTTDNKVLLKPTYKEVLRAENEEIIVRIQDIYGQNLSAVVDKKGNYLLNPSSKIELVDIRDGNYIYKEKSKDKNQETKIKVKNKEKTINLKNVRNIGFVNSNKIYIEFIKENQAPLLSGRTVIVNLRDLEKTKEKEEIIDERKQYPHQTLKIVRMKNKIDLDGEELIETSYNINGNNYFKLRRVLQMLSDTERKHSVFWDEISKTIKLIENESYKSAENEKEEKTIERENFKISKSTAKVELNNKILNLKAYNINGNNFYKLRDLSRELKVEVDWDEKNKKIILRTK